MHGCYNLNIFIVLQLNFCLIYVLIKHTYYTSLILSLGAPTFSYTLLDKKPIEIGNVPLKA